MSRRRRNDEGRAVLRGYVGGELTDPGAEYGYCPDFGPLHEVSSRLSGPEYAYLGHFRQPRYASEGHNDISEPGLPPLHVPTSTLTPQQLPDESQPQAIAPSNGKHGPIGQAIRDALGLSSPTPSPTSSDPGTGGF